MIFDKISNYRNILKNTGYLSIIEIIRLAMPFIALPYIIQTVGAENYGMAVFAQTVITYFSIFINWGLDISAIKDVSVNRNNPDELNKIVSSVLCIKTVLLIIAFCTLLVCIRIIPFMASHKFLFLFAFLTCFSEILFPVWFYQGIEKMKYLTLIRTTSILFYTISVFIFIKEKDDYEKIVFLQSLGNIMAGLLSLYLLFVKNKIKIIRPTYQKLKVTFTESFPFFMSRLSVIFNNTMAKTVSGIFFTMETVAAFDLAQKIANVALMPMQMLNQAVYPHIAKTLNKRFVRKFLYVNVSLSFAIAFIVYVIAPIAVHFFAKEQLEEAVALLRILTLWIFFGGITTYIGAPVLVSFGHSKPFNQSVVLSTVTLFTLYSICYIIGAFSIQIFASILAVSELVILFYRMFYCCKLNVINYE